jgi:hypothetical protein
MRSATDGIAPVREAPLPPAGTAALHQHVYAPTVQLPGGATARGAVEHPADATVSDAARADVTAQTPRAAGLRVARSTAVNHVYAQGLANGCQYSASVRGTLRTLRAPGAERTAALRYQPDLSLRTEVSCAGVARPIARTVPVRGPALDRDALLERLAAQGTLERREDGHRCAFIPEFTLEGETLQADSVRAQCDAGAAARGGGPPSAAPRVPSEAPGGNDYDRFPQIRPRPGDNR